MSGIMYVFSMQLDNKHGMIMDKDMLEFSLGVVTMVRILANKVMFGEKLSQMITPVYCEKQDNKLELTMQNHEKEYKDL
jgi:hypothetical protein